MSGRQSTAQAINGWAVYAHPLFLEQLETLARQVESLKEKNPEGFTKKNATKDRKSVV